MRRMADLVKGAQSVSRSEPVPKGFKTTTEWAATLGYSTSHMGHYLRKLVSDGKVEMRAFRLPGKRLRTPHYREKRGR